MAKPIFIIRAPRKFPVEACKYILDDVRENLPDYHVLLYKSRYSDSKEVQFEVFNVPDFKEEKFEDLQKRLIALSKDFLL